MEKERINENTIRVMIDNSDLKDRGLTIMELLGDHEKIESFFYNILSEVDTDHDFEDDDQVSFQILPNRNGLELFISRLDEDNKISDVLENITNLTSKHSKNIDNVSEKRRQELRQSDKGEIVKPNLSSDNDINHTKLNNEKAQTILVLYEFENVIDIANIIETNDFISDLYFYEGKYYLNLVSSIQKEEVLKNNIAIALEFSHVTDVTYDVLSEHGQLLLKHEALKRIKTFFS
ncbi:adapter protein MecA [Leuconostoc litchii]|uniref:Adaptor protein MecA n=1 Tax=Leuconostoc litchii TaxID=1981069 RepID=A0A652NDQ3_9LACO|nr:adaptor protein MecA [Leuconostoc litchii]TYC46031.1 adaptor protein MecA [Leuconostoc litchii]GMA70259.1 adapter protein MecA [Leuconostoc litchii]